MNDQPQLRANPPLESSSGSATPQTGYVFRDAFRLLVIFIQGSVPLEEPDLANGIDHVFVGEKRAMAIDFLVRYPDYLAHELLDLYDANGDPKIFEEVERIFAEGEPDVRLVKMIRWRRGAYQNIETQLAVLNSRGLIQAMKRKLGGDGMQYEYLLGQKARSFLADAISQQPSLSWYVRQVKLALLIAGTMSGTGAKSLQYEHDEYRLAPYGSVIPSIKERVLRRLEETRERVNER